MNVRPHIAAATEDLPHWKLSYRIDEACAATGIGRSALFERIKDGRIKSHRHGRVTMIARDELIQYIKNLPTTRSVAKSNDRVYFALSDHAKLIKIGYSGNFSQRLLALVANSPVPLTLLGTIQGTIEDERALHAKFSHLRAHGEWFRAEQELVDFIRGAIEKPVI